ncbi:MAG: DUF1684 domain-containing protein [candidate division KSB1 bacterium]
MFKTSSPFVIIIFAALLGCAEQNADALAHRAELEEQRHAKNQHFKHDPTSPLPDSAKTSFSGLHYFSIAFEYRFTGPIEKYAAPETLALATSDGRVKKALRYGRFAFTFEGQPQALEVYRLLTLSPKYADYLFIPFTDMTSGEESYAGGRYLDLIEQKENDYVIDFNLAYNPSCAYGRKDFSCPIPPRNNDLALRIAAGEKNWKE